MGRWTAKSAADHEVQQHLWEARRAVQKALILVEGLAHGRSPKKPKEDSILDRRAILRRIDQKEEQEVDKGLMQRARRTAAQLKALLGSLESVGLLNPGRGIDFDPDLIPEAMREARKRPPPSKSKKAEPIPRPVVEGDD